ncbi:MAG: restriction endonuclease subunit S [Actinomycetes bacterium]
MSSGRSKVPVVRLGEVAKIVSGGTPSRANPEFWGGDIPWVKTANIRNGRIGYADIDERITEAGLKGSSARVVPAGTVLMAMYGQGGTRGRVSVLDTDAAISQNSVAFILSDGVDSDFIFHLLRHHYEFLRSISNSGSLDFLSNEALLSLRVPLPSLTEQRRIAGILSVWDSAIDKIEGLSRAIVSRNRWLAAQLFRRARVGADTVLLGDVADLQVGRTPSRDVAKYWAEAEDHDGAAWLSIADLSAGGVVSDSKEQITPEAVRACSMKSVAPGSVLMSFKLTLGRVAIAGKALYTNEAIVALTPKDDSPNTSFLYHYLPFLNWDAIGNQAAKGKTLNREALESIRLPRIPPSRQVGIARQLDDATLQRTLLDKTAKAYRAQKAFVTTRLVSLDGGDR